MEISVLACCLDNYLSSGLDLAFIFGWSYASSSVFLGLILFVDAIVLTAVGGRTLRYFAHQEDRKTFWPDKFTVVGIYGCMRHPMHLGLALLPVAIALMWGSIPVILTAGWSVAAAFWFVLTIEEKEALQYFGNEYSRYMQDTPAFTLAPKCLMKGYLAIKREEQSA